MGGWIHALDAETGEKLGERHLGGPLAPSGPAIVDDVLVVGSQDGNVYLTPVSEILDDDASPLTTGLLIALSVVSLLVLVLIAIVVLQMRQLARIRGRRHLPGGPGRRVRT